MNVTVALPTGLLALTFLAQPAGDDLRFAPEEGSSVTRTFREKTELELDSAIRVMNGEEMESDDLEVEVRNEREFAFSDRYVAVGEGRIEKLERTYETISSATFVTSVQESRDDQEAEVEGESELEGATVVFTWDEDSEEYEAAFGEDDEGRDADLLDGLVATVDLGLLLPPEEAAEGDSWEVDPAALRALFHFGGDLSLVPDIDPEERGEEPVVMCFFLCLAECGAELAGDVEGTFDGMEETDDGEYAAISLVLDVTSTRDGLEAIHALTEALDLDEAGIGEMESIEFEYAFDGEGTLLWDVEHNRAHRLVLEGDLEVTFAGNAEMGGMEVTMKMVFAGTTELTVEVED